MRRHEVMGVPNMTSKQLDIYNGMRIQGERAVHVQNGYSKLGLAPVTSCSAKPIEFSLVYEYCSQSGI
jgi:hypothetical protein